MKNFSLSILLLLFFCSLSFVGVFADREVIKNGDSDWIYIDKDGKAQTRSGLMTTTKSGTYTYYKDLSGKTLYYTNETATYKTKVEYTTVNGTQVVGKYTYSYVDAKGGITQSYTQTYIYDKNGNLQSLRRTWFYQDGTPQYYEDYEYTRDSSGRLTEQSITTKNLKGDITGVGKYTYIYDSTGKQFTDTYEHNYYTVDGKKYQSYSQQYIYNSAGVNTGVNRVWKDSYGNVKSYDEFVYERDSSNRVIAQNIVTKNASGIKTSDYGYTYSYDSDGRQIIDSYQYKYVNPDGSISKNQKIFWVNVPIEV